MARPKNADAELTRRRILDSAIERFGRQGLRDASLREIAGDVGVTFATVHHYFGNKAALYRACMEASYEELGGLRVKLAETLAATGDDIAEKIDALSRCAFEYARGHASVSRFLLRATLYETEGGPRTRRAQRDYLDVTSAILAPVLGRTPDDLRVPLQGLMFLLTRLAVLGDDELLAVAGTRDARTTHDALADYVAKVAVTTLLEERS